MTRLLLLVALLLPGMASAAELRVLTSGAYKSVLDAMAPGFERQTGHHLVIANETAGGVQQKIQAGAAVDAVVATPAVFEALGPLLNPGTARPLAKVGIGVAVPSGAPRPDIATPDAVRAAALAARAPAWIDPKAGGSSGIYISGLWDRWGIGGQMAAKAVLVQGGLVSDRLLDGRADLAFQQVSELLGHPGVDVVGMLPDTIQSYTVYAGAIPANGAEPDAAAALLAYLSGPEAAATLQSRGMTRP